MEHSQSQAGELCGQELEGAGLMLGPGPELHLSWALWGRTASLLCQPLPREADGCGMQLEA